MWLFCAVGTRNPVGPVATVFPEFIARDGQEPTDVGRQGDKRQGGAARRRSRGHGLARLDGTRPLATVASKVMESGETAGHGNGRCDVLNRTQAQARRPEAGSRAIGVRDVEGWPMPVPSGMSEQRTWSSAVRETETREPSWFIIPILCVTKINQKVRGRNDVRY